MDGITIISGTNRKGSKTLQLALIYQKMLQDRGIAASLLSLEDLPPNMLEEELYGKRSDEFNLIIEKYIYSSSKFIFISPEYNGSYPGVLKVFLDAIHPKLWIDKRAALVGVSQGRAGNLRGMEQLIQVLNYLQMNVYHFHPPISLIDKVVDANGALISEETEKILNRQQEGFINF